MNKEDITMDKEFDFSNAKRPNDVPAIQQLRQAYERSEQAHKQALDEDVLTWLVQQDKNTKERVNTVIRQFMAVV